MRSQLKESNNEVDIVVLDSFDDIPEALLLFSNIGNILARIDSRVVFMFGGSGSETREEEEEEDGG